MGFWTQLYIPLKTGQLYTNTPGILYEKKFLGVILYVILVIFHLFLFHLLVIFHLLLSNVVPF